MTFSLTYAIGDIHGRLDLLQILLRRIEEHAGGRPFGLVFLGDYIDRGPASAAVVETVRTLQDGFPDRVACLTGNHEAMLLSALEQPALTAWWLGNGGDTTLASYGVRVPDEIPPDVPEWMATLPTFHEDDRRYYVHAGLRPGRSLRDQTDEDRLWIREPFLTVDHDFGKHVVHGHTPARRPETRPFRTNLDTGAVYSGVLTAGIFTDAQGPATGFLAATL